MSICQASLIFLDVQLDMSVIFNKEKQVLFFNWIPIFERSIYSHNWFVNDCPKVLNDPIPSLAIIYNSFAELIDVRTNVEDDPCHGRPKNAASSEITTRS